MKHSAYTHRQIYFRLIKNKMNVKNLLLYHTEDKNIKKRKELYTAEGKQYYQGNLYIPDDLEVIEL